MFKKKIIILLIFIYTIIPSNIKALNLDLNDTKDPNKYQKKYYVQPDMKKEKYVKQLFEMSVQDMSPLLEEDSFAEMNAIAKEMRKNINEKIIIANLKGYVDCWAKKDIVCTVSYFDNKLPNVLDYLSAVIEMFKQKEKIMIALKNVKIEEIEKNKFRISYFEEYNIDNKTGKKKVTLNTYLDKNNKLKIYKLSEE